MDKEFEALLHFVVAAESIAASFERYVNVVEASMVHTREMLDQQLAMQQKALADLDDI